MHIHPLHARNHLLTRVIAPSSEPLTLAEAKLYMRVDTTTEDALIGDLIVAARMMAESWFKRSLISQSWKLAYDYGIHCMLKLPMGPVDAVTSVTVFNSDESSQLLDSGAYHLNAAKNALVLNSALTGFRIEIIYQAGYGAADDVPKPIKQGLLSHIAALYDTRGENGSAALPEQAAALYMPYREVSL